MKAVSTVLNKSREELADIIQQVLDLGKDLGVSAAEVGVDVGAGLTANVRKGEVDRLEFELDKALSVTLYLDGKKGSASTSDFNPASLDETVRAAYNIARYTSQDKCAGLVDAGEMATEIHNLDLYHPWPISPEEAIDIAIECEQLAFAQDKRIGNTDGTVVSTYSGITMYGNTHGFVNGWSWSMHSIDCTMIAEDMHGKQRDGWYSKTCDYHELQDIAEISRIAAQRTLDRLGPRKLSTRRSPVIFEAPVASGLFSAFITAISGGSLYRRASFMLDSKGEQVFANHINISECPHIKKALGSAPFDNDGVATRQQAIVADGILQDYVLSGYSARRLGMQTTGNAGGVHNLVVETGEDDLAQLLQEMGTGLLITDMIGFGVNQVTGDYSRGASGFWVENGELAYPVEEITVAGNLKDMYQNIVSIGSDVDKRGNILTGSVLIDNMIISGT